MLSKKHFEAMAEHIARETKPGSKEREGAMHLAVSTAKASNPRFDEGRFRSAVEGLDKGTLTTGSYKTGDGKSHASFNDATKHASDVFNRTGNVISVEKGSGRIRKVGGSSVKKISSGGFRNSTAGRLTGSAGVGDEPRDDHGRWTK